MLTTHTFAVCYEYRLFLAIILNLIFLLANSTNNLNGSGHTPAANNITSTANCHPQSYPAHPHYNSKHGSSGCISTANNSATNPVFYLMASNGNASAVCAAGGSAGGGTAISASSITNNSKHTNSAFLGSHHPVAAHHPHSQRGLHHLAEGRKAKLRRFNSHDTSSNMFSVADFEYARLARRNEIELKQRLQRRIRHGYNGSGGSCLLAGATSGQGCAASGGGDYSTGDSKASKNSNEVGVFKKKIKSMYFYNDFSYNF